MEARIAKLESDVQHIAADIGEIKLDLRALRGENRSDIAGLRADFGTDIAGLSADVRTDLGALQIGVSGEIAALRAEARTDFRLMFGALIAVTVTLAGLMAKGFGWLD